MGFDPERLKANQLEEFVRKYKVSLRGWDFPHLSSREEKRVVSGCMEQWCVFTDIAEVWKFCKSGQFAGLYGIRDASNREWQARLEASAEIVGVEPPKAYLSFDSFVYTISEYFEFASRLARGLGLEDGLSVRLEVVNVQGYAISTGDIGRFIYSNVNLDDPLVYVIELTYAEITTRNRHAALDACEHLFGYFGVSVRTDLLRSSQTKLYEMRIGSDRDIPTYDWGGELYNPLTAD